MIVNHLSRLLDARGVTLAELQRRTGLTYANLHRLANGKAHRYDEQTLDAICSALGCSVGDILEHVPVAEA